MEIRWPAYEKDTTETQICSPPKCKTMNMIGELNLGCYQHVKVAWNKIIIISLLFHIVFEFSEIGTHLYPSPPMYP